MSKVGIAIYKSQIIYCVIDNEKNLIKLNFLTYNFDSPRLISDFKNLFMEIIDEYKPIQIAFKASLDLKLEQFKYMYYPIGILIELCENYNIPWIERSSKWINTKNKYKLEAIKGIYPTVKFNNQNIQAAVIAYFD